MSAGRVGRAHGLDGSFYVTGPRPRLLTLGAAVALGGRATEIVRRAGTDERPIVAVRGVEDRESAVALRGSELTVARGDAPALGEGEWWAGDLEGCEVVDGERIVGVVSGLLELPSCEALEVRFVARGERAGGSVGRVPDGILIPLVRDAIRRVDLQGRRIDVDMSFVEEG
ncbi:MAG TPA: ribosome maturation factor RimM [Solirubrobacteraceae bacterium]|jgi:16S rRNA processing protein RimM